MHRITLRPSFSKEHWRGSGCASLWLQPRSSNHVFRGRGAYVGVTRARELLYLSHAVVDRHERRLAIQAVNLRDAESSEELAVRSALFVSRRKFTQQHV
jgi:hypothetical protein